MSFRRTIAARLRAAALRELDEAALLWRRYLTTDDTEAASCATRRVHSADLIRRFAAWLDPAPRRAVVTARANAGIEKGQAVKLDPNGGVSPIAPKREEWN